MSAFDFLTTEKIKNRYFKSRYSLMKSVYPIGTVPNLLWSKIMYHILVVLKKGFSYLARNLIFIFYASFSWYLQLNMKSLHVVLLWFVFSLYSLYRLTRGEVYNSILSIYTIRYYRYIQFDILFDTISRNLFNIFFKEIRCEQIDWSVYFGS